MIAGYTVKDNNTANGDEGTDTLIGVEGAEFTDGAVNLALVGAVAVFDGNDDLVSVHTTIQAAIDDATTLDGYTHLRQRRHLCRGRQRHQGPDHRGRQ